MIKFLMSDSLFKLENPPPKHVGNQETAGAQSIPSPRKQRFKTFQRKEKQSVDRDRGEEAVRVEEREHVSLGSTSVAMTRSYHKNMKPMKVNRMY